MNAITATTLINVFNGTTNFGTLLGAYLSYTYFGPYKTLGFTSIASFLGLLVIALTAAIKKLSNGIGLTAWQMAFLLLRFALVVVGSGGIRPCNLAFVADQFNSNTEFEKKGINSFFNWYFFTLTFVVMVSLTAVVYVQSNVSWAIGLLIPAMIMLISCAFFFLGTNIYVKVKAEGSLLTSVVQVIVVAAKKRQLALLEQPWLTLFNYMPPKSINSKLPYTQQFR
ncbi:Protein NRT1/ PTR FAMILY 2.11 [Camellia lanceoleosa]|uniref:Protein NRT1/ PTR FAMILY 2.11 n=1 Tax=Camellia lanceoleosa TaxID=1840588 RepID=A0ACC0F8W8_9ERIC|nr:Protein NRT1/ PTR FAMILY 2.11 [Camellia lanceoleosa]